MKLTKSQLKELIKYSIKEIVSEEDSDKYTHIGYGKYKEKGTEDDENSPTFKKTDAGKFVPFKSDKPTDAPDEEKPKPKKTKISADPFAKDDPPFKGGKPSKDDDEFDVGGPAYPKVPKGVKTSADAKGVMKARDLAKQSMDKGEKELSKTPQPADFDGDMDKYLDALNQHMKDVETKITKDKDSEQKKSR